MASQYNLTIESGTDFETLIYIGLGDSGYTFGTNKDYRATLVPSYTNPSPQYSFVIVENVSEKKLTVTMQESTTKLLTTGIWYWDLIENVSKVFSPTENAFTTVNGSSTVKLNWTSHGLTDDDEIVISSSASLPGGYANGALDATESIDIVDANIVSFTAGTSANAAATSGAATITARYKTSRILEGDVLVTPYVTRKTSGSASTEE
jgi:hypothetical protein